MSKLEKAAQMLAQFNMTGAYGIEVILYAMDGPRLYSYEFSTFEHLKWDWSFYDWDATRWEKEVKSYTVYVGRHSFRFCDPKITAITINIQMEEHGGRYTLECTNLDENDGFNRVLAPHKFAYDEVYLSAEESESIHGVADVVKLWNGISEDRHVYAKTTLAVVAANYKDPRDRFHPVRDYYPKPVRA